MADIIVVGIGNPYREDDAAGWAVVDALQEKVNGAVPCSKQRGDIAELMDLFMNYPTVYLVDACRTDATAGSWQRIDVRQNPLPLENAQTSTHGLSISQAVALAKNLDQLPSKLIVYTIAGDHYALSEKLSPAVEQSISHVAQAIYNEEDIQLCMKKV